eukprot:TRINITY_DN1711_c0_g2_i1.p1 TRINITY_DN1711_c0_g2~~TRINITY_DN1711_c0_g2_i1.p1  ORF type:complete len:200 (+),score=32.68 TRINITY_DN1711_c0_g2_i1:163-762(+)
MPKRIMIKVIVLGDSSVGKTSLMSSYFGLPFTIAHKTTVGVDLMGKYIPIRDKLVYAQVWDTAGQERFDSLGHAFFRGSDCAVLVYDVHDVTSFKNLDKWYAKFSSVVGASSPIVVLGNKIDKDNRTVSFKEASKFCYDRGWQYFETSARTGTNVPGAFKSLLEKTEEKISSSDPFSLELPDPPLLPKPIPDKQPSCLC